MTFMSMSTTGGKRLRRFSVAVAATVAIGALAAGPGLSRSSSSAGARPARASTQALHAAATINPTGGAAAPAKQGGTINIGLPPGSIDHLEPTLWYYATSWEIAYATCTPMLTFADSSTSAGVKPIGGVADLPTVSDGGRVYTFKLKPGVDFANGQPINGQAIQYTFDRMLSPALASPGTSFFNVIAGAPAVIAGKAKTISGIKATSDTVTFTLSQPVASFVYRMTPRCSAGPISSSPTRPSAISS